MDQLLLLLYSSLGEPFQLIGEDSLASLPLFSCRKGGDFLKLGKGTCLVISELVDMINSGAAMICSKGQSFKIRGIWQS